MAVLSVFYWVLGSRCRFVRFFAYRALYAIFRGCVMEQYRVNFYVRLLNGFYEQKIERIDAKNHLEAERVIKKKYKNCGLDIVSINQA